MTTGRASTRTVDVVTPGGPARAHVTRPVRALGTLVLTHGAGGGLRAPDLIAIERDLTADGWAVVLVEQAWVVAGSRMPPRPPAADAAWLPVVAALTTGRGALPRPFVQGGRSNGARVACRTAPAAGADAVLCLSFPLHPPGRPATSRAGELRVPVEAGIPVHVVQGASDPFGTPAEVRAEVPDPGIVTEVRGAHGFTRAPADVVDAVRAFVRSLA